MVTRSTRLPPPLKTGHRNVRLFGHFNLVSAPLEGIPELSEDRKNTVITDLDNALCNNNNAKDTTIDKLGEDHNNDKVLAMPSPLSS